MTNTATLTSFLFTDIEGSSLKWLHHRAAMQAALADHDRILRAAISSHAGEVFKTAGDAFLAAFLRPSDAVNAAISAQTSLAAHDWSAVAGLKVRMAVHCGTAEKRDGDYYGPALNRCARLLALAHGGQVLATSASAELLAAEREVKQPLRLIGTHPLDDPAQPVAIHQVLIAGLRQDFPPLRTPESRPTNLPRHLTPLIGREAELQTVREMLTAHRLVTLTGPGGVGKTRLAIEAGLDLLPRFTHGVWLVELAPLSDATLVVSAVSTALRLDLSGNRPPRDILVSHLQSQDILIVLDNCEHLVEAVAELAEAVLGGAPGVRILASSQELIGLPGEQVLRVPPLEAPDAAQLFAQRVKATDAKFVFDDRAASIVSDICRRLDGVPLAIEMAASRAPALGLEPLLHGLDARFRILTGGKRTALPRQRTLHAALDWSHALLNDNDRIIFRRLGVFAGGFTLDAATAVAAGATLRDFDVIDGLADLVAKSLVAVDTSATGTRYRLLETMRAYALEKLGEAGEGDATAQRHARHASAVMQKSFDAYFDAPIVTWRQNYPCELENVRAALDWSFGPSGDAELAIALATSSIHLFDDLSLFDESRHWLQQAGKKLVPSMPGELQTAFQFTSAANSFHGGYNSSPEVVEGLQRAVEALRKSHNEPMLGRVLVFLGIVLGNRGDAAQLEHLLARDEKVIQQGSGIAWFQILSGMLKAAQGDIPHAKACLESAIGILGKAGHLGILDFADMMLAMYTFRAGDYAQAEKSARALRERILKSPFANMRRLLGTTALLGLTLGMTGNHSESLELTREAVAIAQRIGVVRVFVDGWAVILALAGRVADAAQLAGWSDHAFNAAGAQLSHNTRHLLRARVDVILQAKLPATEITRLMAEGAQMSEGEICALAARE